MPTQDSCPFAFLRWITLRSFSRCWIFGRPVRNRGFALVRQFHNILSYPNSATCTCCLRSIDRLRPPPEADTTRRKEGDDLIFRERPAFFPFGLMLMLVLGGYFAFAISVPAIYGNYHAAMDFTVEDSYQVFEQPSNNRCETHYVVKESDGSKGDFVPVPYQFESGVLEADPQIKKCRVASRTTSMAYGRSGPTFGVVQPWASLERSAS
jgi:hypothetical protein